MRVLIVGAVFAAIFFARSLLGDKSYDRIVGSFFLIVFGIVGLLLLYGWLVGA